MGWERHSATTTPKSVWIYKKTRVIDIFVLAIVDQLWQPSWIRCRCLSKKQTDKITHHRPPVKQRNTSWSRRDNLISCYLSSTCTRLGTGGRHDSAELTFHSLRTPTRRPRSDRTGRCRRWWGPAWCTSPPSSRSTSGSSSTTRSSPAEKTSGSTPTFLLDVAIKRFQ